VGDLNILLVVFQAMVAVVSVHFCKTTGIVEDYPPVTVGTLRAWAGVNVLFCLMLFTGMVSLQYNSVPMVTVFKNVANIFTATGDYIVFGNESGKLAMAAFAVMLFGAMAAASKDIECTATGLFWMMANCLATSGYVLYMKHATLTVKTTKFGMVFLNNVLCVIFLLPVAFMFGEVSIFYQSKGLHSMDYFIKNLFAGFVGFFLNFASLNCVQATGPTTYAIVGSVNKIPVAFLGYLLFDNMITPDTWFFISVSMCGGFLYSFASLRSSSSSK
jgi:GDP-mannose transporter